MGSIGDPITQTIPAVGTSGTTYAEDINLFLTEVKSRLEGLIHRVSMADEDLDMVGYGLQTVGYLELYHLSGAPTTPVSATNPAYSIVTYGGYLYWQGLTGAVKITDGTTLNTSLVGGITGDYGGANPAQFRFVDADQEYYAYDDYSGGAWARVWARNFDIAAGATSAVRARLAFGGASSATYTLPAAVPGTDAVMQMTTAGQMSASNVLPNVITAPGYKFTNTYAVTISPVEYNQDSTTHTWTGVSNIWTLGGTNTDGINIPIRLLAEDRITSIQIYIRKQSDATNTITANFQKMQGSNGTLTSVATTTNAANNPGYVVLTINSLTETIAGGYSYRVRITQSDSTPSGADNILHTIVNIDRP